MLVGYARVSTVEQNLDLQRDALEKAGCEQIFVDEISGSKAERPGLSEALSFIRKGDTLVVWRLDRLGRSLIDLIRWIQDFEKRGIEFQSITDSIDTSTAAGRLLFHIAGAFAEYERNIIIERTTAGLRAARKRGQSLGRREVPLTEAQKKYAIDLYNQQTPVKEICQKITYSTKSGEIRHISIPTFYKILNSGTTTPESP